MEYLSDSTRVEFRSDDTRRSPMTVYLVTDKQEWRFGWISSPLKEHQEKKQGYQVLIETEEEGGYIISVPSLPGCITEGDTIEEGMDFLKDAIDGWMKVAVDNKLAIPEPDDSF